MQLVRLDCKFKEEPWQKNRIKTKTLRPTKPLRRRPSPRGRHNKHPLRMPVAKRLAKRNRAVKAVAKEAKAVNDLAAVGRAAPVVNDLAAVARVAPVGVAPVGVAPAVPVVAVTTVFPMNRQMNFPKRFCASTVRPRWSRAVADSALVPR